MGFGQDSAFDQALQLGADAFGVLGLGTEAERLVQLTAHLSRWLDECGLAAEGLTSEVIESFLVDRRQQYCKRRSGQALGPLLGYLRSVGAAPEPTRRADGGGVALLVDRYRRYLVHERGLSVISVRRYLQTTGRFLGQVPAPIEVGLRRLSAGQVVEFVTGQVGRRSVADAKIMVTALRSLLRFLFIDGWIWPDLALAVPTVASRRLASLAKRLPAGQMALLLTSCDRSTAGRRRQLKQRAIGENREVAGPPELTALIRHHIRLFKLGPGGQLFVGERNNNELPILTINRIWRQARKALSPRMSPPRRWPRPL